jgi:hypothetical protein
MEHGGRFRECVPVLSQAGELVEITPLPRHLYRNCRRFPPKEGVRRQGYQRVEEVPL